MHRTRYESLARAARIFNPGGRGRASCARTDPQQRLDPAEVGARLPAFDRNTLAAMAPVILVVMEIYERTRRERGGMARGQEGGGTPVAGTSPRAFVPV